METYAEILNGEVLALGTCEDGWDLSCAPPLQRVVYDPTQVQPEQGWIYDGSVFTAPTPTPTPISQQIKELQQQIDTMDGGKQARQVRTMLIALGSGDLTSLTKLQEIEAQIEATGLRAQISALKAQLP